MAWLAVADVVISILDIALLALLVLLIDYYTQPPADGSLPSLLEQFRGNQAFTGFAILFILFLAKNTAGYFVHKAKFHFAYNVAARLSELNLLRYLEGNYHDYVSKDSAVHIRKISQQPVEFCHYVLAGVQQIFSELVIIALTIIAIILYDAWLFALLCLVLLPPLALLWVYTRKRLATARANIKTSSERSLQYLKEALGGYIESNVYDANAFFTHRYSSRQHALNRYLATLQSAQVFPARMMEIIAVLGLLALIVVNEFFGNPDIVPVITLGAFMAAAYKIIPSLVKILNLGSQVRTYAFTARDLAYNKPMQQQPARHKPVNAIAFREVGFSYDDKKVLENIDLEVRSGELTGLTGLSGRGKTTLFNLLLGFLEPVKGDILINNAPASAAERQLLRRNAGYVKQQPFLVHDSLLTNITLSADSYDEEQLQYAIKSTGLDALIAQLPDGLQTVIAEHGKNISGGQRQRIALARALYKNADVLLLDEPFNELDEASEAHLLQQLRCLSQRGKLVILVTHNTKSLSFCNKIISLDA
jgi:ABC-type bacteriocin/lantibiotic exporter with double-glycine peptidase domain